MITPRIVFEGPKDGSNFEQWLLKHWGYDGRLGWGVLEKFVLLADEFGWEEVYYAVERAGELSKKNFAYCEAMCKGRAKDKKEKQQARNNKPMIQCRDCDAIYPLNGRHECEDVLPVFRERVLTPAPLPNGERDDTPEKVHEIVMGIKEEWNKEEQKPKTVKEIVAETLEVIRNTPAPERVKPSENLKKNYPGVFDEPSKNAK